MIYHKLVPEKGMIFIDGALFAFDIVDVEGRFTRIRVYQRDLVVHVMSVPTDLKIGQAVRTSGHQFKLMRAASVILL